MMKFEAIKKLSNDLKKLLAEWDDKQAPLLEARKKLIEAENEVQNSYDMDTVKRKNEVIKEVGYTLADVDEALKRWHRARFEAVRDFDISAKLRKAVEFDEEQNKGRKDDLEHLKPLQDDFIAKVAPIIIELSNEREMVLNDVANDFDYIKQKRSELTPTDTANVNLSYYENYFTDKIVHKMINDISTALFNGLREQPILPKFN
ncbi:TPA: hypothetical protein QCV70_002482 [Bacillus cereus]|nr:hypothetical protein [Bacillus cereus]